MIMTKNLIINIFLKTNSEILYTFFKPILKIKIKKNLLAPQIIPLIFYDFSLDYSYIFTGVSCPLSVEYQTHFNLGYMEMNSTWFLTSGNIPSDAQYRHIANNCITHVQC